jgi:hypothetical protein
VLWQEWSETLGQQYLFWRQEHSVALRILCILSPQSIQLIQWDACNIITCMRNYTSITYFYMHLQVITPNYKHYMHDTTDPIFLKR